MALAATIVIPTHDRVQTLSRSLSAALAQELDDDYEVIVVNDGKDGQTADYLRSIAHPRLGILEQPRKGPAAARNLGWWAARGQVVLFLDDDIVASPTLLRAHLEAHRKDPGVVSYGPIWLSPDSPGSLLAEHTGSWYFEHWRRVERAGGLQPPAGSPAAGNMAISRDLLERSGGFDESFACFEDTELAIRLWKDGASFRYASKATAREVLVKTSSAFARCDAREGGRVDVALCHKHPEYRAWSNLATIGASSAWKRLARRMALACPVPVHRVTEPFWRLIERLGRTGRSRQLAIWLFRLQYRLEYLRGACAAVGSSRALEREFGARLSILLYHRVGPPVAGVPRDLTVSPGEFEAQMQWLARNGFNPVRPRDWSGWVRAGKPLPPRPLLLTFDDAYADCARYALPILERHGFGAVVYVVTREVGGSNSWDRANGFTELPVMSAADIAYWSARGVDFASHSRTHPDLTQLPQTALEDELRGSAEELKRVLERPAGSFAYPWGNYNAAVVAAARQWFESAITCDEGMNSLGTDLHLLRRSMVQPGASMLDFACRARLGWSPVARLRSWLSRARRRWIPQARVCA